MPDLIILQYGSPRNTSEQYYSEGCDPWLKWALDFQGSSRYPQSSFVTLSGQETPITRHRYRLMILNENTGNLGFVNFYIQFDLIHLLLQICNSTEDWKGCKKQFRNETINAGGFTPLKHVDGNSGFCLEEQCVPYAVVLSIRERDSKGSDTIENCIDMLLRSL